MDDFAELPKGNRENILGYAIGAFELAGAKNIKGLLVETDPQSWKWKLTWQE